MHGSEEHPVLLSTTRRVTRTYPTRYRYKFRRKVVLDATMNLKWAILQRYFVIIVIWFSINMHSRTRHNFQLNRHYYTVQKYISVISLSVTYTSSSSRPYPHGYFLNLLHNSRRPPFVLRSLTSLSPRLLLLHLLLSLQPPSLFST